MVWLGQKAFKMAVLWTFPGQGAQCPGMLHQLPAHPATSATLAQAQAQLGYDPLTLDTPQALANSEAVQLCLLIAGVAMARVLSAEHAPVQMVAGFSIGAYPAAVIAGALSFSDALQLVALRGQLMQQAYPHAYGMAAIVGLTLVDVQALVLQVHCPSQPVYVANINANRQIVLAGAERGLQAAMQLALRQGAQKTSRLAVTVPAHCPLLQAQAEQLALAFKSVELHPPRLRYFSSTAVRALYSANHIGHDLALNMVRQVFWGETARLAWEYGARVAIEMPSGSVLTQLSQAVFSQDSQGRALSCAQNSVENLLALSQSQSGESDFL